MNHRLLLLLITLSLGIQVAACTSNPAGQPSPTDTQKRSEAATPTTVLRPSPTTAAAEPTPKPEPSPGSEVEVRAGELIICQAAEPDSLFLYSPTMVDKDTLHHAIYEPLITSVDYGYQPRGISKLPRLSDGDARIEPVMVAAGDRVVNTDGEPVILVEGVELIDLMGFTVVFDGRPVEVPQMRVDFTLKPLIWSDGRPVTAADSVFSYEINRDVAEPFTEVDRSRVDRTAAYEATGELTVRWTGLPGWLDPRFFLNVWEPLPAHQLGNIPVEDIPDHPAAARRPLSSGPFVVSDWPPGGDILLEPNPSYYQAADGFPRADRVIVRAVPDPARAAAELLEGRCGIVTPSLIGPAEAAELAAAGMYLQPVSTGAFEQISLAAASLDDGRPSWFSDRRVRSALGMCIDRQRIIDELLEGRGEVWRTYVPSDHPLGPPNVIALDYDPDTASDLLEAAGFFDTDGDRVREHPQNGEPFAIELFTTQGSDLRHQIAARLIEDWAACGIQAVEVALPGSVFFDPGPDGPIFGRRFDAALFSWGSGLEPPCHLWLADEIPADGRWDGRNVTGWSDQTFNDACRFAQKDYWGTSSYQTAHRAALDIWTSEMPAIPLFGYVKLTAVRPEIQGLSISATERSPVWNLGEIEVKR